MAQVNCGVVGSPIAHSRSPILHRAAYRALGLTDWTYSRVESTAADLAAWLSGLDDSWRGVSVTMPAKQAALACAHSASELARTLGAANTLTRTSHGWHADNTDVCGLLDALNEAGITRQCSLRSATVVGAGGTGAAAVAALSRLGLTHVDVVVRSEARAHGVRALAARLGMTCQPHPWPATSDGDGVLSADLVISTVPAAATGGFLEHDWRGGQTVVDVTYDPWPPALVMAAQAQGATAIGGAFVLLWQAVGQVELMTGQPAPVEAMRASLLPGGTLAAV